MAKRMASSPFSIPGYISHSLSQRRFILCHFSGGKKELRGGERKRGVGIEEGPKVYLPLRKKILLAFLWDE